MRKGYRLSDISSSCNGDVSRERMEGNNRATDLFHAHDPVVP